MNSVREGSREGSKAGVPSPLEKVGPCYLGRKHQYRVGLAIPTKMVVYLNQTIPVVVFGCCHSGSLVESGG
jgi:hypothetical protein